MVKRMAFWIAVIGMGVFCMQCGEEPTQQSSQSVNVAKPSAQPLNLDHVTGQPRGIDVSHHSGAINWHQVVGDNVHFVFAKATEGEDWSDPQFPTYWQDIRDAGLVRGAYHFYIIDDDPTKQAHWFIETVGHLAQGDLPPVVDVEQTGKLTPNETAHNLRIFLDIIEGHYGVKPIIYTAPNWWNAHNTSEFGNYPLWIADLDVPRPRLPKGWDSWTIWQSQQNQSIAGIQKDVDINLFNGSGPDLMALTIPSDQSKDP